MFAKQFFGKTAWIVITVAVVMHVVAMLVQHHATSSLVTLGIAFFATFAFAYRSLFVGMCIAFAEIMIGGHGHLIAADLFGMNVSLRMIIFGGVMLAWFFLWVQRRVTPSFFLYRDLPLLMLGAAIIIGTISGAMHNDLRNVFDDMNSYLTVLYIFPMLSLAWDREQKRQLLHVLCGSAAFVAFSTLVLVFLFTHLPGDALHDVYRFVRDARLAEVTLLTTPVWFVEHALSVSSPWYFRVFEPAQFFTLSAALLLVAARLTLWKSERMPFGARVLFVACVATFIASLSRSFFIGAFAGLSATLCVLLGDIWRHKKVCTYNMFTLCGNVALGALLFWGIIALPVPQHPDLRDAAFYRENDDASRELAVSSRWNLLYPMWQEIIEHPVVGSGFGAPVTFVSDDPRVRAVIPTGEWTTYRFEWGYQDIWLKMGLLGLAAFVAYAIVLTQAFRFTFRNHESRWLALGLYAGVIALFATHAFSPYLNHPIGIAFMLFVLPFFDWKGTLDAIETTSAQRAAAPIVLPRPAMTMRVGQKMNDRSLSDHA